MPTVQVSETCRAPLRHTYRARPVPNEIAVVPSIGSAASSLLGCGVGGKFQVRRAPTSSSPGVRGSPQVRVRCGDRRGPTSVADADRENLITLHEVPRLSTSTSSSPSRHRRDLLVYAPFAAIVESLATASAPPAATRCCPLAARACRRSWRQSRLVLSRMPLRPIALEPLMTVCRETGWSWFRRPRHGPIRCPVPEHPETRSTRRAAPLRAQRPQTAPQQGGR